MKETGIKFNTSWLSLRDLEYLISVAEHEHFGKAAEVCRVSQPALSTQIKKLEELLSVRLFERTNRKVTITPTGQSIVTQARIVLEEAAKIGKLAKINAAPLSGPLRLGSIATLGPYLMPYLLGPLRKAFPQMELLLKEGHTDGLIADLRAGSLDAVLASPTFNLDGIESLPLFSEPLLLAVPKGHALAVKKPLTLSDLKIGEMILLEDGNCLRDQTLDLCPPNRKGNIQQLHVASIETLRHLVATGAGYTLVPFLASHADSRLKNLMLYRTFEKNVAKRSIALFCRKRSSRLSEMEQLARFIIKNAPAGVQAAP